MRSFVALVLGLLLGGCSYGSGGPKPIAAASPVPGALVQGLVAFRSSHAIGVLDPQTGRQATVVPLPAPGIFRVTGPIWGPAAGKHGQALYFTVHDLRASETPRGQGVVAYDWLFRADPFTGALEPLAATPDPATDGPVGLAANTRELAFTVGCCGDYDLELYSFGAVPSAPVKLPRTSQQPGSFVEGASPVTNWLVLRNPDGIWEWFNPASGEAQSFPYPMQPDDGPVAISAGNRLAVAGGSGVEVGDTRAGGQPKPLAAVTAAPSSLAWDHSSTRLALALNGGLTIVQPPAGSATPAPPTAYLAGAGVVSVDWSAPLSSVAFDRVHQVPAPQALVDGLLAATRLPASDDDVSARARTKVYLWQIDLRQRRAATAPQATVANVTPAFLSAHPALAASVLWHHWAPDDWLLGGCFRYRAVVAGSGAAVASTFSLGDPSPCP
jgi:hypothetical protein